MVIIAAGHVITLDGVFTWGDDSVTETIPNAAVNVSGTLRASRLVTSSLTGRGLILINMAGTLDFGTDASPIPDGITASLILNKATTPASRMGLRQLDDLSGLGNFINWSFVGWNGRTRGVPLSATITAAGTSFTLTSAAHGWKVGDDVGFFSTAASPTGDECETRTITVVAGATITVGAAVTFTHLAGSPVVNLTSNVRINSFNLVHGQMASIRIPLGANPETIATAGYYATFKDVQFGSFGDGNIFSGIRLGGIPNTKNHGHTFFKCVFRNIVNGTPTFGGNSSGKPIAFDSCVVFSRSDGMISFGTNSLWTKNSYFAVGGGHEDAVAGAEHDNNWYTIRNNPREVFPSSLIVRNSIVSGRGLSIATINAPGLEMHNCDLGFTYGWSATTGDNLFRVVFNEHTPKALLKSCKTNAITAIPATEARMALFAGAASKTEYIAKEGVTTNNERYSAYAVTMRDNSNRNRSSSSISVRPIQLLFNEVHSFEVLAANNTSSRIVGYCRANTAFFNGGGANWTPPTVTISGNGITPVVFTASAAANNAWELFDLTATNSSGIDGNFTVSFTTNARLVTTGTVFFDGVPNAPWITQARHYGFLFDESTTTRTINGTISAAEATAAAYAGMTVTWGASSSSVAVTASNTFQRLYDYTQAQACLNLASALPLTGAGVAGSPIVFAAGNVTVSTTAVLNGGGSLVLGSRTLSTEFANAVAYTYTNGTWSQPTTVPSFSGGTLNIPAAGTYTFTMAAATIISMTPTAPSTYNMAAISFTGTADLRNTTAHAITVQVPSGTSTTTANNTGGTITVSAPVINQSVTISGAAAGSRVQIFDTTSAAELFNGTPVFPYTWTDPAAATANRVIRVRVARQTTVTARNFIDAMVGTCGITSATAAVSYLVTQTEDTTYNSNAIDGSTVTGITIGIGPKRVSISLAGGATTWPRIYAYQVFWQFGAVGIADNTAFINAPDTANYLVTDFDLRNTSTVPLTITGGWGRDAVTLTVAGCIDHVGSAGNIYPEPDHVTAFATGSALTAGQDAQLMGLPSATTTANATLAAAQTTPVHVDIRRVKGTTIVGSGTEASPWNP